MDHTLRRKVDNRLLYPIEKEAPHHGSVLDLAGPYDDAIERRFRTFEVLLTDKDVYHATERDFDTFVTMAKALGRFDPRDERPIKLSLDEFPRALSKDGAHKYRHLYWCGTRTLTKMLEEDGLVRFIEDLPRMKNVVLNPLYFMLTFSRRCDGGIRARTESLRKLIEVLEKNMWVERVHVINYGAPRTGNKPMTSIMFKLRSYAKPRAKTEWLVERVRKIKGQTYVDFASSEIHSLPHGVGAIPERVFEKVTYKCKKKTS